MYSPPGSLITARKGSSVSVCSGWAGFSSRICSGMSSHATTRLLEALYSSFNVEYKGCETGASVFSSYLARFMVEPDKCVIPGQHLAVERGIVLGRTTPSHWPADLDRLIQVHVSILERVRVGSAGEHGQRRRHWFWLESVTPTRYEGDVFLIQSGRLLLQSPKE